MALSGERKKKVFTIKQSWVWTGGLLSPVNKVLSVVVNLGIHMIMIMCVVCFRPPKHVTLIPKRRNFLQMTSTQRIAVSIFRYNVAVSHYKKRDKCVAWYEEAYACAKNFCTKPEITLRNGKSTVYFLVYRWSHQMLDHNIGQCISAFSPRPQIQSLLLHVLKPKFEKIGVLAL